MELLRAALASSKKASLAGGKRKASDDGNGSAAGNGDTASGAPVKRFRTRAEIEEEKRQQRLAQQQHQQQQVSAAAEAVEKKAEEASSSSVPSASSAPPDQLEPSVAEVKKRLRALSSPITLFGETATLRWQRLKAVELSREEREAGGAEGSGRNVFHEILTSEVESELRQVLLDEIEQAKQHHAQQHDGLQADDAAASSSSSSSSRTHRQASYAHVTLGRADFPSPHGYILYFFKRMLAEWEAELEARPPHVKRSLQGKVASATQKQTRQYMRPLFTLLRHQQLDADILQHALSIVEHAAAGRYREADEAYLTLAIGNAPWPMGVTMVGIHERSGRERIFSEHVAHVLNDETARKYIQSIKRCISWCREHYPHGWADRATEEEEADAPEHGHGDGEHQGQQQHKADNG